MIKERLLKSLFNRFSLAAIIIGLLFILGGVVEAAGSLVVKPNTDLTNRQVVSVSATGLAHNATGAIVECNNDPNQPTIKVAGNPVPVSCTNPLSSLINTDRNGNLTKSFAVTMGTVGPPATGTDSSGGSAAVDATKYPCPPTPTQLAAGDSCTISFGDASGDDVSQNITFLSQATTPKPTSKPTVNTPASQPSINSNSPSTVSTPSSTSSSTLPNTGPGNFIILFVGSVIVGSLAHYAFSVRRAKTSYSNIK